MSDKDDASKRPARPAAPPYFGPPGAQRTPQKPGGALPPRPMAPFVAPGLRPATPPAGAAGAPPPATPARAATPVRPVTPTVPQTPTVPATPVVPAPVIPSPPVHTPTAYTPLVPHPAAPPPLPEAAAPPAPPTAPPTASVPPPIPTPATSQPTVSWTDAPQDGPSESYLQSPTGEYHAQSGSDLLAFPSVSDFDEPEPRITTDELAAFAAFAAPVNEPEAPPAAEVPDIASLAPDEAEASMHVPSAEEPPPGPPAWGAWASDAAALEPAEPVMESEPVPVDETGLWAPAVNYELSSVGTEADADFEAPEMEAPEMEAPEVEGSEAEASMVEAPEREPAPALEAEVEAEPAPEPPALEPEPVGATADEMSASGEAPVMVADAEARPADEGQPPPESHVAPDAGYPAPAATIYTPERPHDWEAAVARPSSPGIDARAALADRLLAVAQRVRSGEVAVPGLESLASDESALAAVLAAILAGRR